MTKRKKFWPDLAKPQCILLPRHCEECFKRSDHTHCYVCSVILFFDKGPLWHISHLIANKLGGPCINPNLRICCNGCNQRMQTMTPYAYAVECLKLSSEISLAVKERVTTIYEAESVYRLVYQGWMSCYDTLESCRKVIFEGIASGVADAPEVPEIAESSVEIVEKQNSKDVSHTVIAAGSIEKPRETTFHSDSGEGEKSCIEYRDKKLDKGINFVAEVDLKASIVVSPEAEVKSVEVEQVIVTASVPKKADVDVTFLGYIREKLDAKDLGQEDRFNIFFSHFFNSNWSSSTPLNSLMYRLSEAKNDNKRPDGGGFLNGPTVEATIELGDLYDEYLFSSGDTHSEHDFVWFGNELLEYGGRRVSYEDRWHTRENLVRYLFMDRPPKRGIIHIRPYIRRRVFFKRTYLQQQNYLEYFGIKTSFEPSTSSSFSLPTSSTQDYTKKYTIPEDISNNGELIYEEIFVATANANWVSNLDTVYGTYIRHEEVPKSRGILQEEVELMEKEARESVFRIRLSEKFGNPDSFFRSMGLLISPFGGLLTSPFGNFPFTNVHRDNTFMAGNVCFVVCYDHRYHFFYDSTFHVAYCKESGTTCSSEDVFRKSQTEDRSQSHEIITGGCFLIRIDYTQIDNIEQHVMKAVEKSKTSVDRYYLSNPEMYSYLFAGQLPSTEIVTTV